MKAVIRSVLILAAVVALGMTGEWAAYVSFGEPANVANLVFVVVAAIASGWTAFSLSRTAAGLVAAILCGAILWANLRFLEWLWTEPHGHLSIGEFGWGIPWYIGVIAPAACTIAFAVAVLRRRATGQKV